MRLQERIRLEKVRHESVQVLGEATEPTFRICNLTSSLLNVPRLYLYAGKSRIWVLDDRRSVGLLATQTILLPTGSYRARDWSVASLSKGQWHSLAIEDASPRNIFQEGPSPPIAHIVTRVGVLSSLHYRKNMRAQGMDR